MIKATIDSIGDNAKVELELKGSVRDALAELSLLINIIYTSFDTEQKEIFREVLVHALSDNDSPIWQEGLEK